MVGATEDPEVPSSNGWLYVGAVLTLAWVGGVLAYLFRRHVDTPPTIDYWANALGLALITSGVGWLLVASVIAALRWRKRQVDESSASSEDSQSVRQVRDQPPEQTRQEETDRH